MSWGDENERDQLDIFNELWSVWGFCNASSWPCLYIRGSLPSKTSVKWFSILFSICFVWEVLDLPFLFSSNYLLRSALPLKINFSSASSVHRSKFKKMCTHLMGYCELEENERTN